MDRVTGRGVSRALAGGFSAFVLAGCPGVQKDPPPPAENLTITSAAPKALGALAGGTDAAPPVGMPRRVSPEDDPFGLEQPLEEPGGDGGVEDGGGPLEAPEHVPL
jgi:hypothetical protein